MKPTASDTLPDRSALVRLLSELADSKVSSVEYNLAEQLGRLFSVSDSINLARSLGQLSALEIKANVACLDDTPSNKVQDDVLAMREGMIRTIVQSFRPTSSGTGIQAPSASLGTRAEALQTYEPYQRFYSMHQAEMAGAVQSLRVRLRNELAMVSIELHQLAELDRILTESLSVHTAKLFNVIPKLLEWRFTQLLHAHQEKLDDTEPHHWLLPGGWLELFYKDMQELLLAELDLRLQPLLGMLEALIDHISQEPV